MPVKVFATRVMEAGEELTFTCVYPGGGDRMGIDRDDDGVLDASDPLPLTGMVRQSGVPVEVTPA